MYTNDGEIEIGIIYKPNLLRQCFAALLRDLGHHVHTESGTGKEFIERLNGNDLPGLVLIDVDRDETDAYETATYLKANYPSIYLLVFILEVNETVINEMLKKGARGVILKNIDPNELQSAIKRVITGGFYFPSFSSYKP